MTNTNSPGTERPRYFRGQILTEQDFASEQDYFREKLRRHNRLLHGSGVVCGLRVASAEEDCAVTISPGYALDPCGDEILLEEETLLRLPRSGQSAPQVDAPCPDGTWYVAVRYAEIPAQFVPAIGGTGETDSVQPSRIRESAEVQALLALPAGYEARSGRRRAAAGACPPCPPDPEGRWVALAEVRVQWGQVRVQNLKATRGLETPG
jgi:hypothetical protein